ncbi:MAG: surface lipoprotein assembly modifier [Phyllobacterium sp.]
MRSKAKNSLDRAWRVNGMMAILSILPPMGRILVTLAILLAALGHVHAQSGGGYSFDEIRRLVEADKYDEARQRVSSGSGSKYNDVAQAFTEALILKHEGQLLASVEKMQQIVIAYPQFDRVRQELAHSYFLLGDSEHARHQFELLSASSRSPAFRSVYNNYIDAIDASRPWTLDGYVAFAPSTNVTNGVTTDTVLIAGVPWKPENRRQSGIGLSFGGSGTYRFDLANHMALAFGGSLNGTKYRDREFDDLSGQAFSELYYRSADWRFGAGPVLERSLYAWDGLRSGYGIQGSIQRRLGGGGDTVRLNGRLRYLDYDDQPTFSGVESTVNFRYQHVFSTSLLTSLGATGVFMNARERFNAYESIRPYVEINSDLPFGLLGSFSAGYEFRGYDANFSTLGKHRADRQLDLTVDITLRNLGYKGIAPQLEYRYLANRSNVDLYDYDSHNFGLFLTKKY